MTFTGRYEVTQKLQDDMSREFFFGVLLRPRLFRIVACLALLGVLAALTSLSGLDVPYRLWIVGFLSAVALMIVLTWIITFFRARAQGRAGLRLIEHPRIEITLDEQQVLYSSSTGTRRHSWEKIQRIVETKNFIALMAGEIPLLMLPKSCFSAEALSLLRERGREKVIS